MISNWYLALFFRGASVNPGFNKRQFIRRKGREVLSAGLNLNQFAIRRFSGDDHHPIGRALHGARIGTQIKPGGSASPRMTGGTAAMKEYGSAGPRQSGGRGDGREESQWRSAAREWGSAEHRSGWQPSPAGS